MSKRILTIALVIAFALALTLSLGGCKDKGKTDDEPDELNVSVGAEDDENEPVGADADDDSGKGDAVGDKGESVGVLLGEGDEWPDNRLTRQLPKPGFKVLSGYFAEDYGYVFFDMSVDDAKAYAEQLKKAGFDEGPVNKDEEDVFYYSANNKDGYLAEITWSSDLGGCINVKEN